MRQVGPGARAGALVDLAATGSPRRRLGENTLAFAAVAAVEWNRVRREPSVLITRAAQPLLWLLVFGAALGGVRDLGPRDVDYQAFIVPGVIAQSVLFTAISTGLSVVWERDLGLTSRMVVAPVARSPLVLGKALGAGMRSAPQVVLVLVAAAVTGIPLTWDMGGLVGAVLATVLATMFFACVCMTIASLVRSREHFTGLGQLVTLPLFFASTALYPLALMPEWLQVVAEVNPLTYGVDLLRRCLLEPGTQSLVADLAVLTGCTAAAVAVAAWAYPHRVL